MLPVYGFDHDHDTSPRQLADLLGGKGAGLAEMTAVLGLPVPPGFTLGVPLCSTYRDVGWPAGLDELLVEQCARLGEKVGARLGDPEEPLLVAVRSGSARSMPGMLDTVLNLGLNDATVEGLARGSSDPVFAWDSFRRFLRMYATTVLGCEAGALDSGRPQRDLSQLGDLRDEVAELRTRIEELVGQPVPEDPVIQLRQAVEAVFASWESPRAHAYRERERISHDLGTAVNVQAMVFGNRGVTSGTGVIFSRDPSTGAPVPYGDFLARAQGEDVVAGVSRTVPVAELGEQLPEIWTQLREVVRRLEVHYRDICDVEFTVERGRLWVLQTRVGKRSAVAAVRSAVQMVDDPEIALTPAEAVLRVPVDTRRAARESVLAAAADSGAGAPYDLVALGASPGRVSGRAVFDSETAAEDESDDPLILVRPETSPDDVVGMSASVGVLTATGGLVSHAAVVARGWGIPAVVGASDLVVTGSGGVLPDGRRIAPGDVITIDGSTGEVWLGELAESAAHGDEEGVLAERLPELARLMSWAETTEMDSVEYLHSRLNSISDESDSHAPSK